MRILTLDPGGTTGYALYTHSSTVNDGGPTVIAGSFLTYERLHELITPETHVVYERAYLKISTDPIVFEVSGAIKALILQAGCKSSRQEPGLPPIIMARYHLQSKLKGDAHTKDAICHLLHFLHSKGIAAPLDILPLIQYDRTSQYAFGKSNRANQKQYNPS